MRQESGRYRSSDRFFFLARRACFFCKPLARDSQLDRRCAENENKHTHRDGPRCSTRGKEASTKKKKNKRENGSRRDRCSALDPRLEYHPTSRGKFHHISDRITLVTASLVTFVVLVRRQSGQKEPAVDGRCCWVQTRTFGRNEQLIRENGLGKCAETGRTALLAGRRDIRGTGAI